MKYTPWFIRNPDILKKIKDEIQNNFPTMVVYVDEEKASIRGNLPLPNQDKSKIIDQFAIEIALPANYPEGIPTVRELNSRIPRTADRHVNPDGTICLFVPDEKWKYYPDGTSIADFVHGPVVSHLLGQSYYEKEGKFPYEVRSHGAKGILESYSEILGTDDVEIIKTFVSFLSKRRVKGHWTCYCKSGKKLRECHINQLTEYRGKIKFYSAIDTLNRLRSEGI